MSFLYKPESISLVEIYAIKGYDELSNHILATQNNLLQYLQDTMNNSQTSANWREALTARKLGFTHLPNLHGPDAADQNGNPVEIKCESTYPRRDKLVKLQGAGAFTHFHTTTDITRLREQSIVASGFHCGKWVYAISFKVDEIFEQILQQKVISKSRRTALKFSCTNWKDQPNLILHYLCEDLELLGINSLEEIMSKQLLEIVTKLAEKN